MFYHSSYMLYLLSIETYVLISWILHTSVLQVPLPYPGMYLIITTFSSYGWDIATSSTLVSKGVPMRAYCTATPENWRKLLSSTRMVCTTGVKISASRYLFNLPPIPLVTSRKLINDVNGTSSPPGWEDRILTRIKEHWRETTPPENRRGYLASMFSDPRQNSVRPSCRKI